MLSSVQFLRPGRKMSKEMVVTGSEPQNQWYMHRHKMKYLELSFC